MEFERPTQISIDFKKTRAKPHPFKQMIFGGPQKVKPSNYVKKFVS